MEPENQIQMRIIQELTTEFKLADILKVTKFPNDQIKKIKQDHLDEEREAFILTIFKEHDENYGYRRITDELHHRGIKIHYKKVYRLIKKLGLTSDRDTRVKSTVNSSFCHLSNRSFV